MRIDINFASREYIQVRKAYLVLAACLLAGALVFVHNYAGYNGSVADTAKLTAQERLQDARYKDAESRLVLLRKTISPEEVKAASRQAGFANDAIKRKVFSWTAFLNRMEDIVPDGVGITSIRPDFGSLNVEIAGVADNMGQLTEFIDRLTKSQYYEEVPPLFHTAEMTVDKDVGKTVQVFNLKIQYNPEGLQKPVPEGPAPEKPGPEKPVEVKGR